jgi:serine/threonine protein kinase
MSRRKARAYPDVGPWAIDRIIGRGQFGSVYDAHVRHAERSSLYEWTHKTVVKVGTHLLMERQLYAGLLKGQSFVVDTPLDSKLAYGELDGELAYMAMEYAGPSLLQILAAATEGGDDGRENVPPWLTLQRALADAMAFLHRHGYLYLDWKLENVCVSPSTHHIKIVDFGSVVKYRDVVGRHVAWAASGVATTGTPVTMSERALQGARQSRRDDAESLGWMLAMVAQDGPFPLPWIAQVASDADMITARREHMQWNASEDQYRALTMIRVAQTLHFTEAADSAMEL